MQRSGREVRERLAVEDEEEVGDQAYEDVLATVIINKVEMTS